ncbi:MAG: YncE family protein [Candidatus Aminicenantes bacterium]|nr:YncE family protein [Candidatus Aminicenantes bacterium]
MTKKSLIVLFLLVLTATGFAAGPTYRLLKSIPVGADGGWDYLSVDAAARRLYVSHATKVVVIDMDKDVVVGEIADLPGVHGFALAPELGLGFASNGRENKASIVDLKTLKTIAKADTGENPDCILYVPGHEEVYTFNGRGQSATVFEAKTGKVIATIPLGGKPEFAVYDPAADRIYNNIETKSTVVAIDAKTHTVAAEWPLAPGEEASGMAIDLKSHRLFIVAGNKLMIAMDAATGKIVTTVPTGDGTDACVYDAGTGLAMASAGEGFVTIASYTAPDKLTAVQTLTTARGARTMTLDPKTHKIYLSAAEYEEAPAPVAGQPAPRPKMKPGSFKVLVYGPGRAS